MNSSVFMLYIERYSLFNIYFNFEFTNNMSQGILNSRHASLDVCGTDNLKIIFCHYLFRNLKKWKNAQSI